MRPFSQSAEVRCRMCSEPLERVIVDFAADIPFDKASQKIEEHYGIEIPTSTIRRVTQKHAKKMIQTDCKKRPKRAARYINGSTDGVMVPIVEISTEKSRVDLRKTRTTCYKECCLSLACEKGSVTPTYAATMGSKDDAGEMLKTCIKRVGLGNETYLHILGDGAPWIKEQVEKLFGSKANFLIDFYHVSQYLADASKCCCPENPKEWLKLSQAHLKKSNIEEVLSQLREHIEQQCFANEDCPAKKCLNYLEKRVRNLDYKAALEQGLPIGSGAIESGNKHVVQARLKVSGAWWKRENAQAMLNLRTLRANGGWDNYWTGMQKGVS